MSHTYIDGAQEQWPNEDTKRFPSPRPWAIHRTGSHLGIKDAAGKFVFRKVVSRLSIQEYEQLSADFELVVRQINAASGDEDRTTVN